MSVKESRHEDGEEVMHSGSMKISWTFRDAEHCRLDETTKNALEAEAEARAVQMSQQGYREGELCCTVNGTEYHGWWTVKRS